MEPDNQTQRVHELHEILSIAAMSNLDTDWDATGKLGSWISHGEMK